MFHFQLIDAHTLNNSWIWTYLSLSLLFSYLKSKPELGQLHLN